MKCRANIPTKRSRYKFTLSLPSTLPRNDNTPSGRLLYWLVSVVEGSHVSPNLASAHEPLATTVGAQSAATPAYRVPDSGGSTAGIETASSVLPTYVEPVKRLLRSVRTERRIAVQHNPNLNGGTNRLDDDFVHELPGFRSCRVQVRVNEVSAWSSRRG